MENNLKTALYNRRALILLVILASSILVRMLFLEVYWPDTNSAWDDEPVYIFVAEYISSGNSWISKDAPSTRPILLSVLISPLVELSNHTIRVSLVLISSFTPILIFYLSKKAFQLNDMEALIPSLIWVFYPPAIWYSGLILTESLTSLLITATTLCFIIIKESPKPHFVILTGVMMACLVLTRSSYVYLPFFVFTISILCNLESQKLLMELKKWTLIIFTVAIITSPVIIRNYNTIGSILPIETRLPYGLVISNGDLQSDIIMKGGYDKLSPANLELSELSQLGTSYTDLTVFAKTVVLNELTEHAILIPGILFNRTINYWGSRPDPFEPQITTNDIILSVIWIPILISFVFALRFYKCTNIWILMTIILYSYVTTIIFWSSPRFRFPTDSLIIILASVSVLKSLPLISKFTRLDRLKS